MNARTQRLCIWSGPVWMVLFFVGIGVLARFIPPPNPENPPAEVAQLFREGGNLIRAGMVVCAFALMVYLPWVGVLTVQMRRIEGEHSPLAYTQLAMGAILPVAFFPMLYFWCVAAYRPERSDEQIYLLNDMGWVPFTGMIYTVVLQNLVIGVAVLCDKRAEPVFPRWFGYFSLWCGVLYVPASLDTFFTDGLFAWNGLLSWWLSLTAYFVWLIAATILLFRAVDRQEREEIASATASAVQAGQPEFVEVHRS